MKIKDHVSLAATIAAIILAAFAAVCVFGETTTPQADYIDGDNYYKIKYPEHNLVRTRAQYKLLVSMEEQLPVMDAIVRDLCSSFK